MSDFLSQRLKSARIFRGLSMANLESLTDHKIKTSTISRYEKGEIKPSPENLLVLSEALQFKPTYFSKPISINVQNVEYRKKSILTKKKTNEIEERVKNRVERYIEIEDILNIRRPFVNPIDNMVIQKDEDIEDAVDRLLQKWDLGFNPLPNVLNQLEEREIKVLEVEEDQRFEGLAMKVNNDIPVVVVNRSFTIEKRRFNALHELGHIVLSFKGYSARKKEKACHRFAGAMLFPRDCVFKEFGTTKRTNIHIGELKAVNKFYGISCQAALFRAVDLNIMPYHQLRKYYMTIFNNNRVEDGLSQYKAEEKSHRLEQLVTRAESLGLIGSNKAAEILNISVEDYLNIGSVDIEQRQDQYSLLSAFNSYYNDAEDDYSDVELKEINPDYEGWRYLQSRISPA